MKTQNILIAVCGVAAGLSSGMILTRNEAAESGVKAAGETAGPSRSDSRSGMNPKEMDARRILELARKADPASASEFLNGWLALHPDDRLHVIEALSSKFFENPDSCYPFVRDFALALFEHDKDLGLTTVSQFPREQRICNLERHILRDWLGQDREALLSNLQGKAKDSLAVNSSHMYQLASIFSVERAEEFPEYLQWLSGLDSSDAGSSDLQRNGYEALSLHAPDERREELLADLLNRSASDSRFRAFPGNIVSHEAEHDAERAISWLEGMDPGPWKDDALYKLLLTVGKSDIDAGVRLLSRESFLQEFAVGWTELPDGTIQSVPGEYPRERAESLFDSSLESFLEQAVHVDPEAAIESAEAFHNPELKERFQDFAKRLMDRDPEEIPR